MNIDERYPAHEYLEALYFGEADGIAKVIQELLNTRGVGVVRSDDEWGIDKGYNVKLEIGEALNVYILNETMWARLRISIFKGDKDRDVFFEVWQYLLDRHYLIEDLAEDTNDNQFLIDTREENESKFDKLWELMDGATDEDRLIVRCWMTTGFTQSQLEKHFKTKNASGWMKIKLNELRKTWKEIPNGIAEKNKTLLDWKIYLLKASPDEQQQHQKLEMEIQTSLSLEEKKN